MSRSRSSHRDAVAASVTNAPHSRCSSQVSDVVATPAVVTCSRSHVIFGAAKYGSSSSPVSAASHVSQPSAASRSQTSADRRSCQTSAVASGAPVARSHGSTVSPWLASATASTVVPAGAAASGGVPGVDDGAPELLGILFDATVPDRARVHRHLTAREHLAAVADDECLRRGRALVDGQHGGHGMRTVQARIRSPAGS